MLRVNATFPVVNRLTHLLGGELGVAGVEAAAEEAAAVDQVEAEGEKHHTLRFERCTTQRSECLFRTVRHRLEVAHQWPTLVIDKV